MAPFQLQRMPVAYQSRLDSRPLAQIDLLVVHCTELPGLELAREYAERVMYAGSQTGACGHFYVGKGGELFDHRSAQLLGIHDRDGAAVIAGDIVPDPDRAQFDR